MKPAYWIARTCTMPNSLASSSSGNALLPLWKKLWNAKIPGKVLICAWRACNNILPTRARLTTKGYEDPVQCVSCPHTYEDIGHVICGCPVAKSIIF